MPQPKDQPVDEWRELVRSIMQDGYYEYRGDNPDKFIDKNARRIQAECNRVLTAQRQALRDEVLNKATSLAKDILYVASEKERKVYSEKPSKGVGLNELRTAISTIFEGKGE